MAVWTRATKAGLVELLLRERWVRVVAELSGESLSLTGDAAAVEPEPPAAAFNGLPRAGRSIKSIHTDASSLLGQTTKALVNLWEFNPSLALNNNQRRSQHFVEGRELIQQVCEVNEPCLTVEAHVFEHFTAN